MKFAVLTTLTAAALFAGTDPAWWVYASPESTALVGINWQDLRQTPMAAAIEAEAPLPDREYFKHVRQMVISSPDGLAVVMGNFPESLFLLQAPQCGLRAEVYHGTQVWLPKDDHRAGIAQISDQLFLAGTREVLEAAINRSILSPSHAAPALLAQTPKLPQASLWAVAARLPDALVSRFLPLNLEGADFQGRMSVGDKGVVEAAFTAPSEAVAASVAHEFQERTRPEAAVGAQADHGRVTLKLDAKPEVLSAALTTLSAPPSLADLVAGSGADDDPGAYKFEVTHMESSKLQVIRIFNLEDGPREIVLPLRIPTDALGNPLPLR